MARMKFKFKSVGEMPTARRNDTDGKLTIPNLGFKTPLRNTGNSDIFDMHNDPREQIKDNFKNLILTNKGERLGMSEYGCSLKTISYDFAQRKDYLSIVEKQIIEQAKIYLPVILVKKVDARVNDTSEQAEVQRQGMALLKIVVLFDIPVIRCENLAIQVEMFIGG